MIDTFQIIVEEGFSFQWLEGINQEVRRRLDGGVRGRFGRVELVSDWIGSQEMLVLVFFLSFFLISGVLGMRGLEVFIFKGWKEVMLQRGVIFQLR